MWIVSFVNVPIEEQGLQTVLFPYLYYGIFQRDMNCYLELHFAKNYVNTFMQSLMTNHLHLAFGIYIL